MLTSGHFSKYAIQDSRLNMTASTKYEIQDSR